MLVKLFPLIRGVLSYILPKSLFTRPGSGGTFSSEYCYSVWLRHLFYLKKNNLIENMDKVKSVAEIGPGDSLGIGLSALYSGVENYYAFDVIKHSILKDNLIINDDLKKYFQSNKEIPHGEKYIDVHPPLDNYDFPRSIINKSYSEIEKRSNEIKRALGGENSEVSIEYTVPWTEGVEKDIANIDLIFSQAVMEHVYDIDFAYKAMYRWLKKGGFISHEIDFKAHEITNEWDGHWFVGDNTWKILAHGRKYPMNRLPLSEHIKSIEQAGFKIVEILPFQSSSNFINRKPKIKGVKFTSQDLVTSSVLIQAIKE